MAFNVTRYTSDSSSCKIFTPTDFHDWLDSIQIIDKGGEVSVLVSGHDPDENLISKATHARVARKIEELSGLKAIFEPETLNRELQIQSFMDNMNNLSCLVTFNANPTSKIRTILQQSGIPLDIKEAIMNDLQQLWQKQI